MSVADILTSYFFSRLVARVFFAQPNKWIVKGGHALLLRYAAAARLSQDIDIQHSEAAEIDEAVAELLKAAAHDLNDYLTFAPARTSLHENGAAAAKQLFRVHMGTHEVGVLRVDVVARQALTVTPDARRVAPLIDLAWPVDWPQAQLYPIVNQLADKVCAMFERHHGSPSSRYRDLADILLISQQESLDGPYAQLALRTEARRRRIAGVDIVLPESFQPPGPAWPERYPAAARQVPGLKGCATWNEAALAAEAFLSPLLGPGPPGHWNATAGTWHTQPTARQDQSESPQVRRVRVIAAEARARSEAPELPVPPRPSGREPFRGHPDLPPRGTGPRTGPSR
ncbi:nucleotidyl transferase AbiEii/AbiGii toxin family protein [Streptomyces botrytidirepellens]|uniref:Nucleotidyl transferase AbiEii/AbiGii toxin family protein n=1 Tax=Streptomyces botrytidirepellens TaxID=2486417 RepID=A0A3M8WGN2_9ACTN|nr:nucleotidyl transferase AbiEii/AbiGii toxin family protein [Streptomyces botrytidirepellens]